MKNIKDIDKKLKAIQSKLEGKDDVHLFALAFEPNNGGDMTLVVNGTEETICAALLTIIKQKAEFRAMFLKVMVGLAESQNNIHDIKSMGEA